MESSVGSLWKRHENKFPLKRHMAFKEDSTEASMKASTASVKASTKASMIDFMNLHEKSSSAGGCTYQVPGIRYGCFAEL